ncbi:GNAT family N-acetyltransferase [Cellulosimicrobium sp. Marseille-Q4280]|uniref:GNAT family N-acetyltransferase n=1 Tax=Cellulosimicrobium sp. Marseille-Q4280 TaxID=2937992 RepID=UPI00203A8130|nr:GNAT family N-acetyltransferase [Cellulosimicrobium sp. Marseille-Q4280]
MTSDTTAPAATARLTLVDLGADDPRWAAALPVLQALRPHLTADLLRQVLADDIPGPRFLAAFDGDSCLGVAGWRVLANTSAVRKLHVDDLVTAPGARSRGVGAALLGELERRARDAGCSALDLDSGVQRFGAHRFYLRERLSIVGHHFAKAL